MAQRESDAQRFDIPPSEAARAIAVDTNVTLPASHPPPERTKKQDELFRGPLAGQPVTALPGIGPETSRRFRLNGVYTVRESEFLLSLYSVPGAAREQDIWGGTLILL